MAWPDGRVEFEGTELRLRGLPQPGHSPDHCVWLLADQRVGHSADLINIDQVPFGGLAGQEPVVLFRANLGFTGCCASNFEDAQPINVRLMAMAIQPSLPNR